jgi:hypothetical protein
MRKAHTLTMLLAVLGVPTTLPSETAANAIAGTAGIQLE